MIEGVFGNLAEVNKNIVMVDSGTNHTDMWSIYEFSKASQFNYFKVNYFFTK